MRIVKITDGADGQSRAETVELKQQPAPFAENVPPLLVTDPLPATAAIFVTTPDDLHETEPHPAPRPQLVIVLDGEIEIETSDGARHLFTPGTVGLVEDTTGRGHISRVRNSLPATFLAVPLTTIDS